MSLTNIFLDGVLVDVDVSFWSGSKVLQPEDLGLKKEEVTDAFHLGKKMLVPQEVIRAFRSIESKARREVESSSFRFPFGNARFVPKKRFPKVLKTLQELEAQYNKLADDLIENYSKYRQEMLPVYQKAAEEAYMRQTPETMQFGPDYDRDKEKETYILNFLERINGFYPVAESLRDKFSLSWNVYEIAIPRMKEADANRVALKEEQKQIAAEDYKAQIHGKISDFVDEVAKALRQETAELCNHIVTNMSNGMVVKGKTVNSLKSFIERFRDLNFVGDLEVEQQLDEIQKEYLDKFSNEQIKDDMEIQATLKRKLGTLAASAGKVTDVNSVTGEYKRKISWQNGG